MVVYVADKHYNRNDPVGSHLLRWWLLFSSVLYSHQIYHCLVQTREDFFCLIRVLFVFVFLRSVLTVRLELRHELVHCALLNLHASKMTHRMLHTCICCVSFQTWIYAVHYRIYEM